MNKKTYLFFPVEVGIHHTVRSFALADELVKKGHRVYVALTKDKQKLAKKHIFDFIPISQFLGERANVEQAKDPSFLRTFIDEEIKIINTVKPDYTIIDFRLSALASSKIVGVPVVFVTNSDGLPIPIHLPSIGLPKILSTPLEPIFQRIIHSLKERYYHAALRVIQDKYPSFTKKQLLDLDYLVPEIPEYSSVTAMHDYRIYYCGPIFWDGFTSHKPSWLSSIHPNGKTIYISFGGTGYDQKKLIGLTHKLISLGYRVVVSYGTIAKETDFMKHKNLFLSQYLSGFDIMKRVDMVVCHGGIGTLDQALLSKKPTVIIPFNADQVYHALRFQELGLGKVISHIRVRDLLAFNWHAIEEIGRGVRVDEIIPVIQEVLHNSEKYNPPIESFFKLHKNYSGVKRGADIIERL